VVKVDLQILKNIAAQGYKPEQMDTEILWEMVKLLTERSLNGTDITAAAMGTIMTLVYHLEQLEARSFAVMPKDDNIH